MAERSIYFTVFSKAPEVTQHDNLIGPTSGDEKLRIVHLNTQGIRNKSNHLESFILSDCDILCVSEHWLDEMESSVFKLEEWNTVSFFCRTNYIRGGVMLLCKKALSENSTTIKNLVCIEKDIEITASYLPAYDVNVVVLYRSPSGDLSVFLNELEKNLNILSTLRKNCIITGDFNVNFGDPKESDDLICLFSTFGFKQTIYGPTRGKNCIDNIFINFNFRCYATEIIDLDFSDHRGQRLIVELPCTFNETIFKKCRPLTQIGFNRMHEILSDMNWDFIDFVDDPNQCFHMFHQFFINVFNFSFPERLIRTGENNKLGINWFTEGLKNMINHLHFLDELYRSFKELEIKNLRNRFRKKL